MASTIQLKTGTGSAVPSSLTQGEVAINIDNGLVYYGSGSTNTTKQLESFTSITASGDISASGNLDVTGTVTFDGSLTVNNNIRQLDGHISSSNIVLATSADSILTILNNDGSTSHEIHGRGNLNSFLAIPTTHNLGIGVPTTQTPSSKLHVKGDILTETDITASGNISSSGNIVADYYDAKTSGTGYKLDGVKLVYLDSSVPAYTFGRDAATRISGSTIELSGGHVTASGNISASGNLDITGNANIDGTTNLDVVDVDGEFTIANDTKIRAEQTNGTARDIVHVNDGNRLLLGSTSLGTTVQASAANMTLDSAGNIKLDSDTGDIQFQDGGATSIYINSTEGNISASGNIILAGEITASGNISASGTLSATGDLDIDGKSHFTGNITASGDISASGNVYSYNEQYWSTTARLTVDDNTTNYFGPNPQGTNYYFWNRDLGTSSTTITSKTTTLNSGFKLPYKAILTGYHLNIQGRNTTDNISFTLVYSDGLWDGNVTSLSQTLAEAEGAQTVTIAAQNNFYVLDRRDQFSIPVSAMTMIYPRFKKTAATGGVGYDFQLAVQYRVIK